MIWSGLGNKTPIPINFKIRHIVDFYKYACLLDIQDYNDARRKMSSVIFPLVDLYAEIMICDGNLEVLEAPILWDIGRCGAIVKFKQKIICRLLTSSVIFIYIE